LPYVSCPRFLVFSSSLNVASFKIFFAVFFLHVLIHEFFHCCSFVPVAYVLCFGVHSSRSTGQLVL